MNLNGIASSVLVIWYFVGSVVGVVGLVGAAVAIHRLTQRLESLERQIEPSLRRSEELLTLANERLTVLGGAAEEILDRGGAMTETLQERTEATTGLVQRAVYLPFVHANALLSGLTSGIRALGAGRSARRKVNRG